jgi:hypothetical protein
VPVIDFFQRSGLQGRLFSYTDTQLIRLGGPTFHEFPLIFNQGRVSYQLNSLADSCTMQPKGNMGGFMVTRKSQGPKMRARGEKFFDHFTQAALLWNSQSYPEKTHTVQALRFELEKVEIPTIRVRMHPRIMDGVFGGSDCDALSRRRKDVKTGSEAAMPRNREKHDSLVNSRCLQRASRHPLCVRSRSGGTKRRMRNEKIKYLESDQQSDLLFCYEGSMGLAGAGEHPPKAIRYIRRRPISESLVESGGGVAAVQTGLLLLVGIALSFIDEPLSAYAERELNHRIVVMPSALAHSTSIRLACRSTLST